jgi:diadenosine tetraphosphatase ApaH/serine/threonine PP2A family protein phosphatase
VPAFGNRHSSSTGPLRERSPTVKRALISDIHGNYEALKAVLADIRAQGATEIYCLGDIVGYGPNPCECVDEVRMRCKVAICGNHDHAALWDPNGFNPVALRAIYWTREQLDSRGSRSAINDRWDWLTNLPKSRQEPKLLFVHGSARDPLNEYVFPEDIYKPDKLDLLFARVEQYCFQGHTHLPGVFTTTKEFVRPSECDYEFRLEQQKLIVNVGSVGQPRDDDPRACYVLLTDDRIIFRRVSYDVNVTANRIYNIAELDNVLGDRLKTGR